MAPAERGLARAEKGAPKDLCPLSPLADASDSHLPAVPSGFCPPGGGITGRGAVHGIWFRVKACASPVMVRK